MTGFLIIAGPLRWPMSDLKAIKHKTFCKTRMPLCTWRPCNASLANYDNNSEAGWSGWVAWMGLGVHQGPMCRGRSRWLVGPRHPPPLCHKLFPSRRMLPAARYTAEPLCLVATGDKAEADGRLGVLAPGGGEVSRGGWERKTPESTQLQCLPSESHKTTIFHFCYF